MINYPIGLVQRRLLDKLGEKYAISSIKNDNANQATSLDATTIFEQLLEESIIFYSNVFRTAGKAQGLGRVLGPALKEFIKSDQIKRMNAANIQAQHANKVVDLIILFLESGATSSAATGFVIAGFAERELFPSLRSFEIDGMVGNKLRLVNCTTEDIELTGHRARILPFAQQDMVDRFVTGVDENSQKKIEKFCRERLQALNADLMTVLDFGDAQQETRLQNMLEKAADEYLVGLREDGFDDIKSKARKEMEGMVEFMPKVELAQMAESLVELTSIKRRVTRGFETVGGPIDVAVISRSEGFVWIKRKHYFPAELNARFSERVKAAAYGGRADGYDERAPPISSGAGGEASPRQRAKRRGKSAP